MADETYNILYLLIACNSSGIRKPREHQQLPGHLARNATIGSREVLNFASEDSADHASRKISATDEKKCYQDQVPTKVLAVVLDSCMDVSVEDTVAHWS